MEKRGSQRSWRLQRGWQQHRRRCGNFWALFVFHMWQQSPVFFGVRVWRNRFKQSPFFPPKKNIQAWLKYSRGLWVNVLGVDIRKAKFYGDSWCSSLALPLNITKWSPRVHPNQRLLIFVRHFDWHSQKKQLKKMFLGGGMRVYSNRLRSWQLINSLY